LSSESSEPAGLLPPMDTGSATLEQQYNGAILGDTHNAATVAASNTSTRSASGGPPRPMMSAGSVTLRSKTCGVPTSGSNCKQKTRIRTCHAPRWRCSTRRVYDVARPILLGFYCAHFATGRFRPGHPYSSGARITLIVVSGEATRIDRLTSQPRSQNIYYPRGTHTVAPPPFVPLFTILYTNLARDSQCQINDPMYSYVRLFFYHTVCNAKKSGGLSRPPCSLRPASILYGKRWVSL
jgi:hypothetical protein